MVRKEPNGTNSGYETKGPHLQYTSPGKGTHTKEPSISGSILALYLYIHTNNG